MPVWHLATQFSAKAGHGADAAGIEEKLNNARATKSPRGLRVVTPCQAVQEV